MVWVPSKLWWCEYFLILLLLSAPQNLKGNRKLAQLFVRHKKREGANNLNIQTARKNYFKGEDINRLKTGKFTRKIIVSVTKEMQIGIIYQTGKDKQKYSTSYWQSYRRTSVFIHCWWETITFFGRPFVKWSSCFCIFLIQNFNFNFIKRKWLGMSTKIWLQDSQPNIA